MNYTWPQRLHIIRRNKMTYITVILFKRRFHFTITPKGLIPQSDEERKRL